MALHKKLKTFSAAMLMATTSSLAFAENDIFPLVVETDSNFTSIEIRDDAVFVIPPDNKPFSMSSKKGAKTFTISEKKLVFEQLTRGDALFDVYVKSKNKVLGLSICKGSQTSYSQVKSAEGKHKNDVDEMDYCENAALVLQLH